MTDTTPEVEQEPQALSEFLLNYPAFDRAAGAELTELAQTVAALDRKGSMVLKLEVSKVGQGSNPRPRLIVKVNTEVKPPKSDPDAGLFFPGARGLSKDDPNQLRIDWATGERLNPTHKDA